MNLNFSLLALVLRSEGDLKTAKLKTTSHPEKEKGLATQTPSYFVNYAFLTTLLMSTGIQDIGTGKLICSQHKPVWLWATCFTTRALLLGPKCYIHKSIIFVNHCHIKECSHST